ncbi:MAG: hypothetical protein COB53_01100 [Elusimicrobia bacterium]|nr:MAG: hypothetical protein COB53_01100 [Elusimicrobiota bacterium]
MIENNWLMAGIFAIGAGSLIGFFRTKSEGFGRTSTSLLLIITLLTIASLFYAGGKLESAIMANILFSVFGFACGMLASKSGPDRKPQVKHR